MARVQPIKASQLPITDQCSVRYKAMATDNIIPVKFDLTSGTFYTLWAPAWKEHGEEWQAFLGKGDDLYFFSSPEELLTFLNSGEKHDFTNHPRWSRYENLDAETRVVPTSRGKAELIEVPRLLAEQPAYANVNAVAIAFRLAHSLADVAGVEKVSSFFINHSLLTNVERGAEHYSGEEGLAEWSAVGDTILSGWPAVLDDLEGCWTCPEVGDTSAAKEAIAAAAAARKERDERLKAEQESKASDHDPYDDSIWARAGIDPIKIIIDGKTLYSLRCYVEGRPVFLGKFGEIFTFPNPRALSRWVIDNNDHDLAAVATWQDISTAATMGELNVTAHKTNTYTFTGLQEAIIAGPQQVDTSQLSQAYEVVADASDWAGDDGVNSILLAVPELQEYIGYMLGSNANYTPAEPYDREAQGWRQLEENLTSRFSKF